MTARATEPARILPALSRAQALEVARELLEQGESATWGEELAAALTAHLASWRPQMPRCYSDELTPTEDVPTCPPTT